MNRGCLRSTGEASSRFSLFERKKRWESAWSIRRVGLEDDPSFWN